MTSKFTPATRGALIERTAAGVSLADACRVLDLRESTVKGWFTRGRQESEGDYADFIVAIEQARQEARARPGPMTEHELRCRVAEAARAGSVHAMKLAWKIIRADEGDKPEDDPFAAAVDGGRSA